MFCCCRWWWWKLSHCIFPIPSHLFMKIPVFWLHVAFRRWWNVDVGMNEAIILLIGWKLFVRMWNECWSSDTDRNLIPSHIRWGSFSTSKEKAIGDIDTSFAVLCRKDKAKWAKRKKSIDQLTVSGSIGSSSRVPLASFFWRLSSCCKLSYHVRPQGKNES